MATYIFQKIAKEGRAEGIELGTEEARDWFRDKAMSVGRVDVQAQMRNRNRLYNNITQTDIGRMYHFFYDPKHKEKLPYYDRFPLIYVMEKYKDGFLGMNLHYLPPIYRARLMDALYSISKKDAARESEKLRMSYNLMKSAGRFRYFQPCIKRYLNNHIRSRFLYIPAEEWDIALMLPTERFKKSKKSSVWRESKQQFRK